MIQRFLPLLFCAAIPACAQMRVGADSQIITPDLAHAPVYMAGFGNNRAATAVHDDLYARCIAFQPSLREHPGGVAVAPLVVCGVDSIGLFWDDVQKIRAAANRDFGGRINVVVAALHDHQAPDTMGLWGPKEGVSGINEDYNNLVIERTARAAANAAHSLHPARITLARTHPAELDTLIDDDRPPVVHDAEVTVLNAVTTDGKPIATLLNWANHPETLGSHNTQITADYSGYLRRRLEALLGGTAVFINGAVGGMQSPLGAKVVDPATGKPAPEDSFRKAELVGSRVAEIAAAALGHAPPAEMTGYLFNEQIIEIPVTNPGFHAAAAAGIYKGRKPMSPSGATTSPVGVIRFYAKQDPLLDVALVPGEMYPEVSVGGIVRYPGADFPEAPFEPPVKKMMAAPFRMLFGLADDEIGYIIPKAEWDEAAPWLNNAPHKWYGEVNSTGPEAAPMIDATLKELFSYL